mmetsp:Transcript_17425/g.56528  ORF Transcript_17425/g.56528 Transcript_17425/m.56528 type:complete len:89 (-) Transcript_17425:874-1140(-)
MMRLVVVFCCCVGRHLALDTLTSGLASMARMSRGLGQTTTVAPDLRERAREPDMVFFDRGEADAASRAIREALTKLLSSTERSSASRS